MSDDERPRLDTSDIVERGVHAPAPRRAVWAKRIAWLAMLVVIVAASSAITNSLHRADRADTRADAAVDTAVDNGDAATSLADKVLRQCGTGTAAAKELKARGLCTSASDTKDVVAKPGPQGAQGPEGVAGPAPTQSQVLAAVAAYCTNGRCDGEDGSGPSTTQVAAAVSAYCTNGRCRGSDGASASDAQVASAVATYCANGRCRGAAGSDGKNGTNGRDGADSTVPGPQGPAGQFDYPLTFTFTVPGALGDTTYTCSVTGPGDRGSCAQS